MDVAPASTQRQLRLEKADSKRNVDFAVFMATPERLAKPRRSKAQGRGWLFGRKTGHE
jgi:hypothetical protein